MIEFLQTLDPALQLGVVLGGGVGICAVFATLFSDVF